MVTLDDIEKKRFVGIDPGLAQAALGRVQTGRASMHLESGLLHLQLDPKALVRLNPQQNPVPACGPANRS